MDLAAEIAAAQDHVDAGRLEAAERHYRRIVAEVDHLASLHNLAVILNRSGRTEEAGAIFRRAAEAAPDKPFQQHAYANHLRETRRMAASEAAYRATLALDPDYPEAAFGLGCVLLAQGRFAEGWTLYDRRAGRARLLHRGLPFPEWRGEPLAGKRLLIWREQGFGDQIMMSRFLPQLAGASVTYAGPAQLQRLFSALPVTFEVAPTEGYPVRLHDYWILPMSLPQRLGVTVETLPNAPYLSGRPKASGGRIGVAWRGQAANRNDPFRSLPDDFAAKLLALPGAISLDPADTGAADFQETADIIAGLDLVISVDSAVAHLAGAMGHPVWVMLAARALDWHWPRQGTSPWYPTARLFAQQTPGDWAPVVAAVGQAVLAAS